MYLKTEDGQECRCLECGDVIVYGRRDKKFCSDKCKNKYNYKRKQCERALRTRVISSLTKNYAILDKLLQMDLHAIDLCDLVQMGFNPDVTTSYRKVTKHDEYRCFDIKYYRLPSRIVKIERSLMIAPVKRKV